MSWPLGRSRWQVVRRQRRASRQRAGRAGRGHRYLAPRPAHAGCADRRLLRRLSAAIFRLARFPLGRAVPATRPGHGQVRSRLARRRLPLVHLQARRRLQLRRPHRVRRHPTHVAGRPAVWRRGLGMERGRQRGSARLRRACLHVRGCGDKPASRATAIDSGSDTRNGAAPEVGCSARGQPCTSTNRIATARRWCAACFTCVPSSHCPGICRYPSRRNRRDPLRRSLDLLAARRGATQRQHRGRGRSTFRIDLARLSRDASSSARATSSTPARRPRARWDTAARLCFFTSHFSTKVSVFPRTKDFDLRR
jgi:hypothetical protein